MLPYEELEGAKALIENEADWVQADFGSVREPKCAVGALVALKIIRNHAARTSSVFDRTLDLIRKSEALGYLNAAAVKMLRELGESRAPGYSEGEWASRAAECLNDRFQHPVVMEMYDRAITAAKADVGLGTDGITA